MTIGLIILVIVIVTLSGAILLAVRSAGKNAEAQAPDPDPIPTRPQPMVVDFHVKGDTASVHYGVPLGDGEAGTHLTDLLAASAIEFVRTKVREGLPLDGVSKVAVLATRGDEAELLTTVTLPSAGQLPDPSPLVTMGPDAADPIAAVQAVAADPSVASAVQRTDSLPPVAEFIELSDPTDAHLRSIGIDPTTVGLEDLVLGLLRIAGYHVEVGRPGFSMATAATGDIYGLTKDGRSSILVIVRHEEGSYPEIDDQVLAEFSVAVAQLKPHQAILVTDKFSPYSMYEREQRDNRLVFVTRERLQAFVDSFGLQ
ncbi:MAG: hypothetical protein ACR2N2_01575 [Acidimicrobiia bacterium]